jgi:hypothetical protein
MTFCVISLPDHTHGCEEKDDEQLEHEYLEEHLVHQFHHIANFCRLKLRIHHDLCLIAQINRDTVNIFSIPQCRASQAKLFDTDIQYFRQLY